MKIAGGTAGNRAPVSSEVKAALEAYLAEEKDAGMKIEIVNENRNRLKATLRVWYDPMELRATEKPVDAAVKAYVSNLDFDGLLSRNGLVDELRKVAGVEMVRIAHQEDLTRPTTTANDNIDVWKSPYAQFTDVWGFNYRPEHYADYRRLWPGRPVVGTETMCTQTSRGEYQFHAEFGKAGEWGGYFGKFIPGKFCKPCVQCRHFFF